MRVLASAVLVALLGVGCDSEDLAPGQCVRLTETQCDSPCSCSYLCMSQDGELMVLAEWTENCPKPTQ